MPWSSRRSDCTEAARRAAVRYNSAGRIIGTDLGVGGPAGSSAGTSAGTWEIHAFLQVSMQELRPRSRGHAENQRSAAEEMPELRQVAAAALDVGARVQTQGRGLVRDRFQGRSGQQKEPCRPAGGGSVQGGS